MDIIWGEIPLRQALESLARNKKIAVLIDRRVDPSRKIEISLHQTPLKDVLETVAQKCNLGISMVGPVAYFAPPEVARRVRTIAALRRDDVRRLAPAVAKKFFNQKSMAWDDFAQPRELLEKLGTENGIRIEALDQIPHDLWAAADLPPLELIERLTLIAGQYDLTFQVSADGNQITLLPVPEHVEPAQTNPAGKQSRIEDREHISATLRTAKRYTLTVKEKPIGQVLEQLAPILNLDLKIDDEAIRQAGVSLDQRVSFNVKDATLDELLRAALQQTRLKFVRRGNIVQIEPSQVK
jgi:hypothetical protein